MGVVTGIEKSVLDFLNTVQCGLNPGTEIVPGRTCQEWSGVI